MKKWQCLGGKNTYEAPPLLPNAALSSSTIQLNQPAKIACRFQILCCASRHKHAYVKNA
jgi:hypothetical protein